jgi:phage terminase large subunit-like protein
MNLPESAKESAVADWELIAATNKPLPELKGRSCTVGIDYSKLNDWAAVNIHFRTDEQRYDINHAWVCASSADIPRIKAPWREWAKKGDITIVDDVEIHPSYIVDFVSWAARMFAVEMVALDSYRYALLADALSRAGFSKERKNLMLVKQTDILKVVPVIDHCFRRNLFTWGDVPHLRWATNNTKVIPYGKDQGADKGSFVYAKIEGKSRKTDPFMALVASMVPESHIKERPKLSRVGVITF